MEVISLCNTKNLVREFKEIVDMKVGNYEFLIDIIESGIYVTNYLS